MVMSMWFWQKKNHTQWLGMASLAVFAIASVLLSVWGILGFPAVRSFALKEKTTAIVIGLSDCKECSSPDSFLSELKTQGLVIGKQSTVDADSKAGKKLVEQYNITKLPTVLLRKTTTSVQSSLAQFGETASDGTFVLRDVVPPYRDVTTSTVKGRFGVILLTDTTCKECYDAALHKTPLAHLGMIPADEKTIDIADAEGKQLIEKYHIETVPTLIMQGDLGEYKSLNQVWDQVGTTESDGAYVFRKGQESMGIYRVLKTGEIKKPKA